MKPVLNERMLLFAEVDGEPAGFCFGVLDWTPLFRSFRGRFGPLQVIRFLRHAKQADRAGALGIAVLPEHRGKGVASTLLAHFFAGLEDAGYTAGLYYPVNEDNRASGALAESFGGQGRVLYHCYDKRL